MVEVNTIRRAGSQQSLPASRGFTLIEIMVVLVIVMLLAGMILTAIRPALEARRMREAARSVSTMLYQAKARAVETGRPFGIWIERSDNSDPNAPSSRTLYFAESPPMYAGDTENARALIRQGGNAELTGANTSLIEAGDFIRFNYQDPIYEITSAGGSQVQFAAMSRLQDQLPKPAGDQPMNVPFQILRKPRKAIGTPVQLSGNVVIDLTKSGIGSTGVDFAQQGSKRVIIMFSPSGHVDRVYKNDSNSEIPASPIHILLGRNEKVASGENLQDRLNLWVSIGNQSGLVTTSPILTSEGGGGSVKDARLYARQMLGMGGR
jgi:prepilin-type N-terminal cleavage/methylation domain-containing protein